MTTIIVTDIFGRTEHVEKIAVYFKNSIIIDPYDGKNILFADEAQAYQYFNENCGLDRYTEKLSLALSGRVRLIGFSVGASAVWNVLSSGFDIESAVCFYGSRIRDNVEVITQCPVLAVFPAFEPSFDVDSVVAALSDKPNVEVEKTQYLHGFMNKLSVNFNAHGYLEYLHRIK